MSAIPPLVPYIVVNDAAAAMEFYKTVFGTTVLARYCAPNSSRLMHVHLLVNGGHLMMCDDFSSTIGGAGRTPLALGGTPVTLALTVDDADAVWERALAAGAEVKMPLADQFWGQRYGQLRDPFGHVWSISQHIANPTPEEIESGAKESLADKKPAS